MTAPDTDTLAGLLAGATRGALTIAGPSREGDYAIITSDRKIVGEAYAGVEHAREHDPRRAEAYASLFAYSPFLAAEVIALRAQTAKDKARIERLEVALRPFSVMAGEMFARNWNNSDVAISFVREGVPIRLTFINFMAARAALEDGE